MFEEFKKDMIKEFEMTEIGFMSYYLRIEVKQEDHEILITQEGHTNEVLKKFKIDDANPIDMPMECEIKLSKHKEGKRVDPSLFKSLVGSLQYLTSMKLNILNATGIVGQYMEHPTITHLMEAKRILCYIKCTTNSILQLQQ